MIITPSSHRKGTNPCCPLRRCGIGRCRNHLKRLRVPVDNRPRVEQRGVILARVGRRRRRRRPQDLLRRYDQGDNVLPIHPSPERDPAARLECRDEQRGSPGGKLGQSGSSALPRRVGAAVDATDVVQQVIADSRPSRPSAATSPATHCSSTPSAPACRLALAGAGPESRRVARAAVRTEGGLPTRPASLTLWGSRSQPSTLGCCRVSSTRGSRLGVARRLRNRRLSSAHVVEFASTVSIVVAFEQHHELVYAFLRVL
jgi:hypothetical protein